jgi:hypothetical protein
MQINELMKIDEYGVYSIRKQCETCHKNNNNAYVCDMQIEHPVNTQTVLSSLIGRDLSQRWLVVGIIDVNISTVVLLLASLLQSARQE